MPTPIVIKDSQSKISSPTELTEVNEVDVSAPSNLSETLPVTPMSPTELAEVSDSSVQPPTNLLEVVANPINRVNDPIIGLNFQNDSYESNGQPYGLQEIVNYRRFSSASFWNRRRNELQQWETFLDTDYVGTVTNLFTYSEDFANADWAKTSFVTLTAVPKPIGNGIAYRIVASNNVAQHQIAQSISFTSGTTYTASIYVKADGIDEIAIALKSAAFSVTGKGVFNIKTGSLFQESVSDGVISSTYQGNGVYLVSYTRTATATGADSIDFEIYGGDSVAGNDVDGLIFWGAQLTESAKPLPYVKTLASSASNTFTAQPRIEYDPVTAQPLGYLSEGASANISIRSEEFDDAAWTKQASTVTANEAFAPDGTKSMDVVEADSTASIQPYVRTTLNATLGVDITFSIFVKAREAKFAQLIFGSGEIANDPRANFDLINGTLGTVDADFTASIKDCGNGIYRISVTGLTASTTVRPRLVLIQSATDVRAASNSWTSGDGLYAWGAQLESLPFPSSYVRTEGGAVTRSRDAATASIAEGSFTNEFSVSYEARHKGYVSGDILRTFVLSDDTGSNRFVAGVSGTENAVRHFLITDAITQFSDASNITFDEFRSVQATAKTNEAAVYIDGTQDYQALTVDVPEFNKLDIAINQDANTDFDGFVHIKNISIYDQYLLASEIPQGASIEGITPVQENKVLPVPQ